MKRRRVLAATGSAAALAGCLSVPSQQPSSDRLLEDALETVSTVEDVSARRALTVEVPDSRTERVADVTKRPPTDRRLEMVDSSDLSVPAGAVSVRTTTTTWEYDPETDTAIERHHPNRILADVNRLTLESLREEYDHSYSRTDTVDGRDAHALLAKPDHDEDELTRSIEFLVGETVYQIPLERSDDDALEDPTVERLVWFDDATRYPIKERTTVRDGEAVVSELTLTYEDLSLDDGVGEEPFTYEPPAGSTIETVGTEPVGIYDSRAEAAEVAPYELPEPEIPGPFERDRIVVLEKGDELGTSTTLWYGDPDDPERELFVAVRDEQRFDPDALEGDRIDDLDVYCRDGRIQTLFWRCAELTYEVSSPYSDEPLEEVASSIGCPSV